MLSIGFLKFFRIFMKNHKFHCVKRVVLVIFNKICYNSHKSPAIFGVPNDIRCLRCSTSYVSVLQIAVLEAHAASLFIENPIHLVGNRHRSVMPARTAESNRKAILAFLDIARD